MYEKICLISDTHLDFWAKHHSTSIENLWDDIVHKCEKYNPDLIVFAGDQGNGFLQTPSIGVSVSGTHEMICIPGNHDYYHGKLPEEPLWVENEHIIGTTLWTRFDHHVIDPTLTYRGIADSRFIEGTSAAKMIDYSQKSFEKIYAANKQFVVTHFPAFQQSASEKFRGDPYNSYFINDMGSEWVKWGDRQTELWMCGHVHHKHIYNIDDMLVACNPMGYPNEIYSHVKQYAPMLIVQKYGSWIVEMYQ